jgi:UDP-glucose 4-epimerase
VSIFVRRALGGQDLNVFGDGTQTRDLLYVEDCADFIVAASFHPKAVGEVINAGTGRDIPIKELALLVAKDPAKVKFVPHHHPQSEVWKLQCDPRKAKALLGWEPRVGLEEGTRRLSAWMQAQGALAR